MSKEYNGHKVDMAGGMEGQQQARRLLTKVLDHVGDYMVLEGKNEQGVTLCVAVLNMGREEALDCMFNVLGALCQAIDEVTGPSGSMGIGDRTDLLH